MLALHKGDFLGNITGLSHENGVTACITDYVRGDEQADSFHYHDHAQLYLILNGGSIEKRKNSVSEKMAGSLLFYHAGETHQNIRQGDNAKSLNVEIEMDFLERTGLYESQIARAVQTSPDLKFALLRVYQELRVSDDYTAVSIEMLLHGLLHGARQLRDRALWPAWVKIVHELLHERWSETVGLKELAAASGVNPITISKHFPRYFNCTLGQYVRKLRVEKALFLIKTTKQSLTETAFECGFADQSHFIRSFKELTGFLPSTYRGS
jgi:AraC family transcriptional regulator